MGESFKWVILVFADYYITDRLLMMPANSLRHSGDGRRDQHSNLQVHSFVRNIHLMMLDCELDFRSNDIRVLINGDLVHWRIVLLLLLLLRLLLFLRRHRPVAVYNYRLVSFLTTIITLFLEIQKHNSHQYYDRVQGKCRNKNLNNSHYKIIKHQLSSNNKIITKIHCYALIMRKI